MVSIEIYQNLLVKKIIPFKKHSYKILLEEAGEGILFTASSIFIFVQSWLTVPQVFNDFVHTEHSFSSPNTAFFSYAWGLHRILIGNFCLLLQFMTFMYSGMTLDLTLKMTCFWLCEPFYGWCRMRPDKPYPSAVIYEDAPQTKAHRHLCRNAWACFHIYGQEAKIYDWL